MIDYLDLTFITFEVNSNWLQTVTDFSLRSVDCRVMLSSTRLWWAEWHFNFELKFNSFHSNKFVANPNQTCFITLRFTFQKGFVMMNLINSEYNAITFQPLLRTKTFLHKLLPQNVNYDDVGVHLIRFRSLNLMQHLQGCLVEEFHLLYPELWGSAKTLHTITPLSAAQNRRDKQTTNQQAHQTKHGSFGAPQWAQIFQGPWFENVKSLFLQNKWSISREATIVMGE